MSLKHTYSLSVKNDSGSAVVAATYLYTASSEENFNDTAPFGDTLEIDLPVDVSTIVSFYVVSNKAVTLKTNNNITPDQTFVLVANEPLWWNTDQTGLNPLTTDITTLFFVNGGLADATVKGGFLLDLTV